MTDLEQWTEAVARAICAADGQGPDDLFGVGYPKWTLHIEEARAAIHVLAPLVIERCAGVAGITCVSDDGAGGAHASGAFNAQRRIVVALRALKAAIAEAGRGKEARDV